MDPSQPVAGRARGRGRGLYAHPEPAHIKDPQFVSKCALFYHCFRAIRFSRELKSFFHSFFCTNGKLALLVFYSVFVLV